MYILYSQDKNIPHMINIYDIYIYIYKGNKSKYIRLSDGALTRWRHHMNKSLHNRIEPDAQINTWIY